MQKEKPAVADLAQSTGDLQNSNFSRVSFNVSRNLSDQSRFSKVSFGGSSDKGRVSKLEVPLEQGPSPLQASKLPEFPPRSCTRKTGSTCKDEPQQWPSFSSETSTQHLMHSLQEQLKEHSDLIRHLLKVTRPMFEKHAPATDMASGGSLLFKEVKYQGHNDKADKVANKKSRSSDTLNHKKRRTLTPTSEDSFGQKVVKGSRESVQRPKGQHTLFRHTISREEPKITEEGWGPWKIINALSGSRMRTWFEEQSDAMRSAHSDELDNGTLSSYFERAVESPTFNIVTLTLIGLNAILIGWQADQQMHELRKDPNSSRDPPQAFELLADVFSIIFAVELVIRIVALRGRFIFTPDIKWNLLDTLLVASGIIEMIVDSSGATLSFARVLRILRMVRVLRVVRMVRFFDSLRKMVGGLMNCLLSLFWLVMLLFIVLFVFAVACMQGIAQHLEGYNEETASLEQQKQYEDFMEVHGGLQTSILSLLETISDGRGWHIVIGPVMDISWIYGVASVVFVFFTIFGVMNVVTGIFVDRALYISQCDRNVMIRDEVDKNQVYIKELKDAFTACDRNGDGMLTREEVQYMLNKTRIQAMFRMLELNITDVCQLEQLWELLDPEATGMVEIDDFVQACLRLKGVASSMDVCALLLEVSYMRELVDDFRVDVLEGFDDVFKHIDCLVPASVRSSLVRRSSRRESHKSAAQSGKNHKRFKLPMLSGDMMVSQEKLMANHMPYVG